MLSSIKKKNFLLVLISTLLLALCFYNPNITEAHTTTCKSGSESVGWAVNCDSHAGTKYINYTFSPSLETAYKNFTYTGVANWNNTSVVSFSYSVSSNNIVTSHGGPDTSTTATTTSWKNPLTGHKTRWELSYNKYVMDGRTTTQNNATATHELGHGIGLKDLKLGSNNNKIMYGYGTRTVSTPVSSDITGAREAIQ